MVYKTNRVLFPRLRNLVQTLEGVGRGLESYENPEVFPVCRTATNSPAIIFSNESILFIVFYSLLSFAKVELFQSVRTWIEISVNEYFAFTLWILVT